MKMFKVTVLLSLLTTIPVVAMRASRQKKAVVAVERDQEFRRGNAFVGGNWRGESGSEKRKYDTKLLQKGLPEAVEPKNLKVVEEYPQVHFLRADISGNNLSQVKLPNLSMQKTNAQNIKLSDKTFIDPKIKSVRLSDADLTKLKLVNGSLRNVNLQRANLKDAFIQGNVRFADFRDANLEGVSLGGRFATAAFAGACMNGVTLLPNTDLRGATGINMSIDKLSEAKKNGCKFGPGIEAKIKCAAMWSSVKDFFVK